MSDDINNNLSADELGAIFGGDIEVDDNPSTDAGSGSDGLQGILEQAVAPLKKEFSQLLSDEVELSLLGVEESKGINAEGSSEWYFAEGTIEKTGQFSHGYLFPATVAQSLVAKYSGVEDVDNDEEQISEPLGELTQNILNSLASSLGNGFTGTVGAYSLVSDTSNLMNDQVFSKVNWKLGDNQFFEFISSDISNELGGGADNASADASANDFGDMMGQENGGLDLGEAAADTGGGGIFGMDMGGGGEMSLGDALLGDQTVSSVDMPVFDDVEEVSSSGVKSQSATPSSPMNMLMDVSMTVTVELGNAKKTIGEILELNRGSIIELKKLAGEPLDIKINQKLIARGEVVVIDEYFGVRIIEVVSSGEKNSNLNE